MITLENAQERYEYLVDAQEQAINRARELGPERLEDKDDVEAQQILQETNKIIRNAWIERYDLATTFGLQYPKVLEMEYAHLNGIKERQMFILNCCKEDSLKYHDSQTQSNVEKWTKKVKFTEQQIRRLVQLCFEGVETLPQGFALKNIFGHDDNCTSIR